jgi:hypothetical protein
LSYDISTTGLSQAKANIHALQAMQYVIFRTGQNDNYKSLR